MPKILGLNHLLLNVKDMNRNVDFFVNVLGFSVKGTAQQTMNVYPDADGSPAPPTVKRLYFFQAADGFMITCAEAPSVDTVDTQPVLPNYWPEGVRNRVYGKVDHIALSVESRDDLVHFQKRLREFGIAVSEIHERMSTPKFVKSIYFHTPDGFPMEIATWDWSDPHWETASKENYMRDPDPVPALKAALGLPDAPSN